MRKLNKLAVFMIMLFGACVNAAPKPTQTRPPAKKAMPVKPKPVPKPLAGLVLILDPGHGGEDPGAHDIFRGENIWEAPYTFDQAARVKYFAERRGAKVYMTVVCKEVGGHRNWSAQRILEKEENCRFALDGSKAKAGRSGLNRRVKFANNIVKWHRGQKVVFLSIHFDIAGEGSRGAFVIVPSDYKPDIAGCIVGSLDDLASKAPLRVAGQGGQKNLQVLRGFNGVSEKILIELGNFNNERDNWLIRNYETRNRFAIRIADALQRYQKGGCK
jgi:N-acetylmuramoyl-L-alanine amidase